MQSPRFLLLFLCFVLLARPLQAEVPTRCENQVCLPLTAEVGGHRLPLQNMTLIEFWGIDVYTAGLYVAPEFGRPDQVLGDVPKKLVFHYHHRITKDEFAESTTDNMRGNPEANFKLMSDRLQKVNQNYSTVKPGDRYEVTYQPGQGTSISLNGGPSLLVPGVDFQRAYFGIWLSRHGISDELRQKLLRGN